MARFIQGPVNPKRRRAAMQAALYAARKDRVEKLTVTHTFDTLDSNTLAGGTLSADKLTFTSNGTANAGALSKTNKTSGKWYFEVTIVQFNGGSVGGVGAMDKDAALSTASSGLGTHGICGFFANGPIYHNGSNPGNPTMNGGQRTPQVGDVIAVGIDVDNKTARFQNLTSGGTASADVPMVSESNYCAAIFMDNSSPHLIAKMNFGASAFAGTMFSGYKAWG